MRYLATRFSAKEAFSKAIGLGMRMPMTWRGCEIVKTASGKPEIRLHGELAAWFAARGLRGARHRHRRDRLRGELRRRRNQGSTMTMIARTRPGRPRHRRHDAQRRRPPPPAASADRRPDPVRPQLAGPAPAHRADHRDQVDPPRPADLRRPRRRPRAALSHRRLHATCRRCARSASCGCTTATARARRDGRDRRRHRGRLRARRRAARLRRRPQLHAGARPRPRPQRRDRRPRVPPRPARRRRCWRRA